MSTDEPDRPYPSPVDLALGRPAPAGWAPDGIVIRNGHRHEVSIVKEEGDELFVSGLTFAGWIFKAQLVRAE